MQIELDDEKDLEGREAEWLFRVRDERIYGAGRRTQENAEATPLLVVRVRKRIPQGGAEVAF